VRTKDEPAVPIERESAIMPTTQGADVDWETLARDIFEPPRVQLENVVRWNKARGWDFTPADIDAVDVTPDEHTGLVVDVIVPFLPHKGKIGGVQRTFDELWLVASLQYNSAWRLEKLKSDPEHLSLLTEHVPGIHRVTLDLGAHFGATEGIRPRDVRGADSPHAEVLAAAAHFPGWIHAMGEHLVPNVWMPGYELRLSGNRTWRHLPFLGWDPDSCEIQLTADSCDGRYFDCACPVRL
jgi:hypothetical protein